MNIHSSDEKSGDERTKGIISLIILALIYGGTGVIVRLLSVHFTDFQQIYLRTFLALVFGFFIFKKDINLNKLRMISSSEWQLLTIRSVGIFPYRHSSLGDGGIPYHTGKRGIY